MEIKNYKELFLDISNWIRPLTKDQDDFITHINENWKNIIQLYKVAENYEDFENEFFFIWYNILDRQLFVTVIEESFNFFGLKLPDFFFKDKEILLNIFDLDNNISSEENENDENEYIQDIFEIGSSRIEIRSRKSNFRETLESEAKIKRESEIFNVILKKTEELVWVSNSYKDYFVKLKPFYYELYNLKSYYQSFEHCRKSISYAIPYKREEWHKDIPKVSPFKFVSEEIFNREQIITLQEEEELLKLYENKAFIFKPLITNDEYSISERKKFLKEFPDIFKDNKRLFDFVDSSIQRQVIGFIEYHKRLANSIKKHRDEKISIYEDLVKEINASSLKDSEKEKLVIKYEKEIDNLKSKIITPKGYDVDSLVKYYIECAINRKLGDPSVRDLEKGSEYKKDKWNSILKNDQIIFGIWSELHKLKMSDKYKNKNWFSKLYDLWTNEFSELQKKDRKQSDSYAIEYKDYINENE